MGSDTKFPVSLVISAVDQATAKMREINQRMEKALAPVTRLNNSARLFGDAAGFSKIGDAFQDGFRSAGRLEKAVEGVGLRLVALAAGALFAGERVASFLGGVADAGKEVEIGAHRLGLGAQGFQELAYAAIQAKVPQEELVGVMAKLQKNVVEAALGNEELATILGRKDFGGGIRDANGQMKSLAVLFPQIADGIAGIKDATTRAAVEMKLFGRSGGAIDDLLRGGSAGLAARAREFRELGGGFSAETLKRAEAYHEQMVKLETSFQGVKYQVAGVLMPTFERWGEQLTQFFAGHHQEVEEYAQGFAARLPWAMDRAAEGAKDLWKAAQPLAEAFAAVAERIGTGNTALLLFGGYLTIQIVPAALETAAAVWGLGTAVTGLGIRLGTLVIWPAIVAVKEFAYALDAGAGAATALDFALMANPWGVAIVGIAGIAAGAIFLYKHLDEIREALEHIWNIAKFVFSGDAFRFPDSKFDGSMPFADFHRMEERQKSYSQIALGAADDRFQAALGPARDIPSYAQGASKVTQEASVKVSFENLPPGARVEGDAPRGLPLELLQIFQGYSSVGR